MKGYKSTHYERTDFEEFGFSAFRLNVECLCNEQLKKTIIPEVRKEAKIHRVFKLNSSSSTSIPVCVCV